MCGGPRRFRRDPGGRHAQADPARDSHHPAQRARGARGGGAVRARRLTGAGAPLSGEIRARVDGDDRTLSAGETLDIPRGTKHQMWNASSAETRLLWQTRPAGRTEQWFRTIDRLIRENGGRMPGPAAFAAVLGEYRDVFRLAAAPDWALRPALGALGAVGRMRGRRS
ncbi:MAG: cupin domain-containing protein [Actinobacteria bacterium]|nr:MAG: cupin domain-containing protein [Actinomycetota bacterium]